MLSPNDLASALARNVRIVKLQSEGVTHAESLMQLPFQGNCLNWVVGHLARSRDDMLEVLGEPLMMGGSGTRYERGSDPLTEEGEGVLPLEALLAQLEHTQEHLEAVLGQMEDAQMAREMPPSNGQTATLGQQLFGLYFHEVYHVGQTELLRQLTGKNDKLI